MKKPTAYGPKIGTWEERDKLWAALDMDPTMVALPDDFAAERGLPKAERFPWDKSKGVYQLEAFHQLHCLVSIPSSQHQHILTECTARDPEIRL